MDHFYFEETRFTILLGKDGSKWLVGRELCDFLRLNNISNAMSKLPDECKQKITIEAFKTKGRGGDNGVRVLVNREGSNRLIVQSFIPVAERFKKWLLGEVYGEIEDTGSYNHANYKPRVEQTNHTAKNFHIPEKLTVKEALLLALDREEARERACAERDHEVEKNVIAGQTIRQAHKKINYLEDMATQLKRKAHSYDQRINTIGNYTFNGYAKNIGVKPHTLTRDLRSAGILFKTMEYVMAKETYIDKGWFVVKERKTRYDESKRVLQAYITPLGAHEIWELLYAPKTPTYPTPWRGQKGLFDD